MPKDLTRASSAAVFFIGVLGLFWQLTAPAHAGACVVTDPGAVGAFGQCRVQTSPVPVDIFFGNQTGDGGKSSFAYEAWDADIGEPVRQIYFDDAVLPGAEILLSDFGGTDRGVITVVGQTYFAIKTGGDVGLFPLILDPDNLVVKQQGTNFIGVANVNDLTEPNTNLLGPGTNQFVEVNFAEGLSLDPSDVDGGSIKGFGTVEAVGAFVSTLNAVTLSIFQGSDLIFEFTMTPPSTTPPPLYSPFFMGIVLPRDDGLGKFEIIDRAVFTFAGSSYNALDGLVYTTVVDAPLVVAEPNTLAIFAFGLAGFAFLRRRRRAA
ncbi:MAG: PEP-CTERM sorting domain-containing protein [Alphaproteobacteria bacterium]